MLLGTSDAGAHWSALASLTLFADPPVPLRVYRIAFASPTLGLAAARDASCRDSAGQPPPTCPGWILVTGDGGRHWHLAMKSTEPVVAVAFGPGAMWALIASPGGFKVDVGSYRPSLTLVSSRDGGVSWKVRGAVHPPMIAGLDGAWSSGDGGRHWRTLRLGDRFERGLGVACGYGGAIVAGGTVAVSFNRPDCAGPSGRVSLRRSTDAGRHWRPIAFKNR